MLDLEDLRQQYDRLTDDALLQVAREDLVDLARDVYDAELARRGLKQAAVSPPPVQPQSEQAPTELVVLEGIGDPLMARSLLESAGIPSWTRKDVWDMRGRIGPMPYGSELLVAAELEEQALEILATPISDEELAAQAEAAGLPEEE